MFLLQKNIRDTLAQGITYLDTQQQKDGSFISFSSPDPENFTHALQFHTSFSTSLILDAVTQLKKTTQLKTLKEKATSFLLSQRSDSWSWNYWKRNAKEAKTMPYPDDLDDTFCALAALFRYDPKIIDGATLAHVVRLLTLTEEKEGGPYRTWLIPKTEEDIWQDVDIAVNSNIAYFLSLEGIELPGLNKYIDVCIEKNKFTSPYYSSEYPIFYFISRFYKGKYQTKIVQTILERKHSKNYWGNPLNTALAILSLLNFQIPSITMTDAIKHILQQQKEGVWNPYAFYTGVNPKKNKTYFAGSSAITTAYCLQAVTTYQNSIITTKKSILKKEKEVAKEDMYNHIVEKVLERFSLFDNDIKKNIFDLLDDLLKTDTQKQIVLLPYYFSQTLGEKKKNIANDFIIKLGMANVFGWIAYTIYDNFLDEEGDSKMLSLANIALRELTSLFEHILPEQKQFTIFFHEIMDQLDQANAWEIANSRGKTPDYKNYKQLAQKSLGHGLGPLAVLFSLGYKKKSPEIKNLLLFFTHYLIARQLNDDAHDWEKDLKIGHVNAVCALNLKRYSIKEDDSLPYEQLLPQLQQVFWNETIEEVCDLVYTHTKQARLALEKCSVMVDTSSFKKLLAQYETAAHMALEEKKQTRKFLKTYNSEKKLP